MARQQTPEHFTSERAARTEARAALMPVPHASAESPAWDRFIRLMRVTLPASAAILGAVTVLWPFLNDTEVSFTLSKDDVAKSDGQIRMTKMRYTGTDSVNRLFKVEAAAGIQDTPSSPRIRLSDIRAEMEVEPGVKAHVSARTGIYRMKESTLSLVGGVHVETGNGYRLDMAGAEVDLKAHTATGQGEINGQSKLGTIRAGHMEIIADKEEGTFSGGIDIHITPERPGSPAKAANRDGTGK
ncbi:LPS export ABC transporter periplasmic protein LptC [Kordiimonas marina]|uniref:LPS export ABC transporter periplasmic protein LptC n=1 Tax=Kordiimonas marina TaxID=2872312 RepID=UPI001FF16BE7|nr:LPS export ABC transporter periplasmic protein LptC [Kordiimonas marina]MCJ9428125.1 hypothetical protein [Kordiimonas marina]